MDTGEGAENHSREGDRQFVTALARGLDILRAFDAEEGPLGNQELARRTGLPKPTISRLTYTLSQLGFLIHNKELGVYSLGGSALSLGYVALANLDVRRIAHPMMQALADACGGSVSMGVRDRLAMLYVDSCEGRNIVSLRLSAGARIPLPSSAMGRAYIAGMSEQERAGLLDIICREFPDDKQILIRNIEKSVREIETRGFCLVIGDWREDINGVGAPLVLPDGSGIYAVNCGGPGYLLKGRELEEIYGPKLAVLAQNAVSQLGTPAIKRIKRVQ